jgi:hypothetical protein
MSRALLSSGAIVYSPRAFHQDANEAMRGDIVRGIIELVTNSDDAYAEIEDGTVRKIVIEVEHRRGRPWIVVVRDRATGMGAKKLVDAITKLGGRTSGFETGAERRGNLGRGAKDCAAFGDVTFKTIHEGQYAELTLRRTGKWQLEENRTASREFRKQLGVPRGNGTVVQIMAEERIRCPRHDTLRKKLATHYQLRSILSDPLRRVELVNLNDRSRDLLNFEYPNVPIVFEDDLEIEGYPGANAHLIIYRHETRYDDNQSEPGRPAGILIIGKRAIYENTLFSFENTFEAGRFSGKLTCQYIDQLAREYDDRLEHGKAHPQQNPMPIISRRREGLNHSHPFYEALRQAVESPLGELVAEETDLARQAGNLEDARTRADLQRLAREMGRLMNEELRDIEAEELIDSGEGEVPLLVIVPESVYAYVGENRTLTVAARRDRFNVGDEVQVFVDPEGVVDLLTPTVTLKHHSRREDLLAGQIQLQPLLEGESTLVTASAESLTAVAMVEVRPPREVVEEELKVPETLEFERASYRIGWQRERTIQLVAPAEAIAEEGSVARILSSDPGIVIRTPMVELQFDDALDFYCASIRAEARVLDATGELRAEMGNLIATAQVKVTRKESGPSIQIRIEPRTFGSFRAIMEAEQSEMGEEIQVIKIAGHHPAIRPYLGDDGSGQSHPTSRLLVAEAVADVAARHIVQKLYQIRRTAEDFDADRIYREHNRRLERFLPRFQRLLVRDTADLPLS